MSDSTLSIKPSDLQSVGENVQAGIVNGKLVLVIDAATPIGPSGLPSKE